MISRWRVTLSSTFLSMAAVASMMPAVASAGDDRPYRGVLDLNITSVTGPDADGIITAYGTLDGTANHLGRLHGMVVYYIDLNTGAFEGTAYKVAADGDILYESLEGQFLDPNLTTAIGTFAFDGGTGRFANASGDGVFYSEFSSPTEATVDVDARLSYDASDRAK